jgi:hypothetical protein
MPCVMLRRIALLPRLLRILLLLVLSAAWIVFLRTVLRLRSLSVLRALLCI